MSNPYSVSHPIGHSVALFPAGTELHVKDFLDEDTVGSLVEPIGRSALVESDVVVPQHLGQDQARLRVGQVLADALHVR